LRVEAGGVDDIVVAYRFKVLLKDVFMKTVQPAGSRWPLLLHAMVDSFFPVLWLFLLHSLWLDQAWLEKYSWLGGLAGVFMLVGMALLRGYSRRSERTLAQKLERVVKVWFVTVVLLTLIAFVQNVTGDFSRVVVLVWAVTTPLFLLGLRLLVNRLLGRLSMKPTKVVLLGDYRFTDFEKVRLTQQQVEVSFSSLDELETMPESAPDFIVMNSHDRSTASQIKALTHLELEGVRLIKMEQFMETFLRKCYVDYQSTQLDYLQDVTAYSRSNYLFKRLVDVSAALSLLLLVWPVMLYAAWRIRRESPGKVFFVQERVGLNGKAFRLFKFRSMHENAHFDPYTQKEDTRIFPFGKVMRKTRIDELPQLWNVLKGEMHFFGPRSEWNILVENYEKDIPFYHERHLVAPGISGWAQVMYPYGACVEDARQKLMYDLYYIKNWSIWLEIETLILTVGVVLGKKGI